MFCPRCGCNLNGNEKYCPECGNVLVEQEYEPAMTQRSNAEYLLWFLVGFILSMNVIYMWGQMFIFLFIPLFFFGRRKSRSNMFFLGAMAGSVIGLLLRMLL